MLNDDTKCKLVLASHGRLPYLDRVDHHPYVPSHISQSHCTPHLFINFLCIKMFPHPPRRAIFWIFCTGNLHESISLSLLIHTTAAALYKTCSLVCVYVCGVKRACACLMLSLPCLAWWTIGATTCAQQVGLVESSHLGDLLNHLPHQIPQLYGDPWSLTFTFY